MDCLEVRGAVLGVQARTRGGWLVTGVRWAALGLLVGLLVPARAQAETRVLTLDQALAMARRTNRTVLAERERLAQARTNLEQAWAVLFPTVLAQGRYTRNNISASFPLSGSGGTSAAPTIVTIQPLNQLDGTLSFNLPLIAPAAYPALAAVKSGVHAAEADYETSLTGVLFSVAQAYYASAIADEVVPAREPTGGGAPATLQNAETRFSAGSVTKVDVDRAQLAVVRAEQALRESRFAEEQSYRSLATLIQSEGGFKVEAPPLAATEPRQDLGLALKLRPEFRALELVAKSERLQTDAYGWRWAPTLSGFGNARIFNYDTFALQRHAWAVGLELDWVLYDGGVRDAQRHLAAAQARESLARAQALSDTIRDDLANGHGLLDTKRHAYQAAEQSVGLAVETLDLVRTQYEAGNVTQIELLQAQDNLVAAKEALAQAHFEMAMADLTLRRTAGTFPGREASDDGRR
jgi:outer membrane protein